jgi:alcohol dehydrogenase class IV
VKVTNQVFMSFSFILPQKVIFGIGSIESVGEECKMLGGMKVLIVTSPGMLRRAHLKQAADSLKRSKVKFDVFSEVTPEPPIEDVYRCIAVARKKSSDLIVGLGGGSVMDVAKKAAADLSLPKIMLPTTAGTGSEVTHESVLKVDGKKRAFVESGLTADVAIVDPDLCQTMSKRLAASSAMDALAHAVECSESKKCNPLAKTLALEAYNLVKDNLMQAVKGDTKARVNLSLGSLLAGMAFGNSGTALGHALSYPLSNRGMPHGEAVAIALPYALEFNGSDPAFAKQLKKLARTIEFQWDPRWNISEMAAEVMQDERHLGNNPVKVTSKDVLGIFEKMKSESLR